MARQEIENVMSSALSVFFYPEGFSYSLYVNSVLIEIKKPDQLRKYECNMGKKQK